MTTTAKQPIVYSGEGSAIDNYIRLQNQPEPTKKIVTNGRNWGLFDNDNQAHRQLISLCYQAQWTTPYKGRNVADTLRLSEFLKSDKSPVNKALKKMTKEEVSKVIVAFEGIVLSIFRKRIKSK